MTDLSFDDVKKDDIIHVTVSTENAEYETFYEVICKDEDDMIHLRQNTLYPGMAVLSLSKEQFNKSGFKKWR